MNIFNINNWPSITKKFVMALTGIIMCLFLVGHLVGNSLIFVGAEAFNTYADFLGSTKLTYLVEIGLLISVLLHIFSAVSLTLDKMKARPVKYKFRKRHISNTWISRHMLHSGMVIAVFLILHIGSFKFGEWDNTRATYSDTLYDLVVKSFSNVYYSGFYVLAMIFLGFHLHHAIKSSFITLGITRKSSLEFFSTISFWFSLFIAVGFSIFPVYFFLIQFGVIWP